MTHYCGFVDANMLCLLWPLQLQSYRVCFVSGPLTRPLISVFQPPAPPAGSASEAAVAAAVEGLTEIVIRSSGDHFTLLRPLHAPAGFKASTMHLFIFHSLRAMVTMCVYAVYV